MDTEDDIKQTRWDEQVRLVDMETMCVHCQHSLASHMGYGRSCFEPVWVEGRYESCPCQHFADSLDEEDELDGEKITTQTAVHVAAQALLDFLGSAAPETSWDYLEEKAHGGYAHVEYWVSTIEILHLRNQLVEAMAAAEASAC